MKNQNWLSNVLDLFSTLTFYPSDDIKIPDSLISDSFVSICDATNHVFEKHPIQNQQTNVHTSSFRSKTLYIRGIRNFSTGKSFPKKITVMYHGHNKSDERYVKANQAIYKRMKKLISKAGKKFLKEQIDNKEINNKEVTDGKGITRTIPRC